MQPSGDFALYGYVAVEPENSVKERKLMSFHPPPPILANSLKCLVHWSFLEMVVGRTCDYCFLSFPLSLSCSLGEVNA